MILDKTNVAELWRAEKARADQLAAELECIRVALNGDSDSDLATLAGTIVRQNRALAANSEQWRNAIEAPLPVPPVLEVARSVEAAIALLQSIDKERIADSTYFAGYTTGYRDGYRNRRFSETGEVGAC